MKLTRTLPLLLTLLSLPVLFAQDSPKEQSEPSQHPFLWSIQKADSDAPTSYLFGTIHVPDERVLNLHPVVTDALDQADAFFAELDFDNPGTSMMSRMTLPSGAKLSDILPEDLAARIDSYLKKRGMSLSFFKGSKVWALMLTLTLLDQQELLAETGALDQVLYERSKEADKVVGGIETFDEQIDALDGFTQAEQIVMLTELMDELEESEEKNENALESLIQAYLAGDLQKMYEDFANDYKEEHAELQQKFLERMLWQRNVRIAERVDKKLGEQANKSFFFAFGAAHFADEKGLIKLLEKRGYTITRVVPEPVR